MKTLMIAVVVLVVSGIAEAAGPAFTTLGAQSAERTAPRTIRQSLDAISREIERPKTRPTDPPPAASGGGISGPLGRTCAEARERMRWSDLPCSPFMPEK